MADTIIVPSVGILTYFVFFNKPSKYKYRFDFPLPSTASSRIIIEACKERLGTLEVSMQFAELKVGIHIDRQAYTEDGER